jgi:hypothetical protein
VTAKIDALKFSANTVRMEGWQGESASLHPLEPLQFSKEVLTATKQLGHE